MKLIIQSKKTLPLRFNLSQHLRQRTYFENSCYRIFV